MWESFGDIGFPTSEKVVRKKKRKNKETSVKYNGLHALALAMLEARARAGDITVHIASDRPTGSEDRRRETIACAQHGKSTMLASRNDEQVVRLSNKGYLFLL